MAASVDDLVAISSDYTFIADKITSGGTAKLVANTLYDENRIFAPTANSVATNKGSSTIGGEEHLNSLRLKNTQDQLVFKVARPCTVKFYTQSQSSRGIQVGSKAGGTEYGSQTASTTEWECQITQPGLVYLSSYGGDFYFAGFEVTFAPLTATFENDANWAAVFAYTWSGADESKVEHLGAWPGTQLTETDGKYVVSIKSENVPENIIFNDGGTNQTADLEFKDGGVYKSTGRVVEKKDFTVNFKTDAAWTTVYAYTWTGEEKQLGAWPGTAMTKVSDGEWTVTVNAEEAPASIIFHNNEGTQTADLTFEADKTYEYNLNTYTATFTTDGEWANVYAYAWSGSGDAVVKLTGEYPGQKLEAADGVYTFTYKAFAAPEMILFNDGGDTNKTPDMGFTNGRAYKWNTTLKPLFTLEASETNITAGTTLNVVDAAGDVVGYFTYGVEGGADFAAPTARQSDEYAAFVNYTAGNGENGTATSGTVYYIKPIYDGSVTVGVWLNGGKSFYIQEDGTSLAGFDGYKQDYGSGTAFTFNVKGGSTYAVYCTGSKLGFYGFDYTFTKPEPVKNTYTATFTNAANWAEVYAYAWTTTGEGEQAVTTKFLGDWPGKKLEAGEDGKFVATIEAEAAPAFIIFNNGAEGEAAAQTEDLAFEDKKEYTNAAPDPVKNTYTATLANEAGWENVYAYAWTTTGEGEQAVTTKFLGDWPGKKLEAGEDGKFVATIEAEAAPAFIIFNNGAEGEAAAQTEDLAFEDKKEYTNKVVEPAKQTYTATFTTTAGWEKVFAYAWYVAPEGEVGEAILTANWPGNEITATKDENGVYTFTLESALKPSYIIFNNGDEAEVKEQTEDLEFENGKAYTYEKAPEPVNHTWDFTKWSEETVANLKADAANSKVEGWSDVEKAADAEAGNDPTELSKDNCFWYVGGEKEPTANGVAIAELKGLEFDQTYGTKRSLAIAVNYPETSLGTYNGPAYLWLGGKNSTCFTIKNVKVGSELVIGAESHKITDGRGIQLKIGDENFGEAFTPKTFEENKWTVTSTDETAKTVDVLVTNTNGCHIYYIDAEIAEVEPAETVEKMYIVGDFLGLEKPAEGDDPNWNPENGLEMTPSAENDNIWTLEVKGFVAEAKKYEYKATANKKWGVYELPASGNAEFVFGTEGYPAGTYDLVFTADLSKNELSMTATKQVVLNDYTVQFVNNKEWKAVSAYAWSGDGETATKFLGDFPGTAMGEVDTEYQAEDGQKYQVYELKFQAEAAPEKILFNNGIAAGEEGAAQTGDLAFEDGKQYVDDLKLTWTASYVNSQNWEKVYAYAWYAAEGEETGLAQLTGNWPGIEMTKGEEEGVYTISFEANMKPTGIIFNNGIEGEGAAQTADFVFEQGQKYEFVAPEVPVEDIEIKPESGDIAAALAAAIEGKKVGNITIRLNKDAQYTIGATLTVPNSLFFYGNDATVTVAEEMTDNFITLNGTEAVVTWTEGEDTKTNTDHKFIKSVEVRGVTIKGLKGALVKDNQKTLVENLVIDYANIEMPAAGKNVIDFNGKGYVGKVTVTNSTIWANGMNTGFFAQYGSRPKNINGDWLQEFDIENSTIVNIANGKNICDVKQNGTAQNVYTLKNNIFVDCGKGGQTVVGFNKGQASATPTWAVTGNYFAITTDGVITNNNAAEIAKAGKVGENDIVQNCVEGTLTFTDAAAGDFNGEFQLAEGATAPEALGAPIWTITYKAAPVPADYYLVGNMTEWSVNENYKLTKNENAGEGVEEYMINVTLASDAQFKIVGVQGGVQSWYPDGMGNNYGENGELTSGAGDYTVYFRPNRDGGDDWFHGYIYVVYTTGINSIAVDQKLKDAEIYNLNGQRVLNAKKGLYIVNGKKVVIK